MPMTPYQSPPFPSIMWVVISIAMVTGTKCITLPPSVKVLVFSNSLSLSNTCLAWSSNTQLFFCVLVAMTLSALSLITFEYIAQRQASLCLWCLWPQTLTCTCILLTSVAGIAVKTRVWGREGYKKGMSETPPYATPTQVHEQEQVDAEEPLSPQQPEMENGLPSGSTAVSNRTFLKQP